MGNHYHRFETPEGNLVEGMKWLQNTYTRKFNESLWHSRVTSCPKAATYYQHEIGRRVAQLYLWNIPDPVGQRE